jgi:hypothetical protein
MAAVGSITFSNVTPGRGPLRPVQEYSFAWTSSAGGAVSGIPTPDVISGQIVRAVFIPGTGGAQPSNAYSAQLTDGNGMDVLANQGASLSNVTTTHTAPGVTVTDGTNNGVLPIAVNEVLTLVIAAAGNAKSGTLVLYIR